ncbi:hypothetical protein [Moorena sp. SIO4G3]|nr:hypothetical protein [Moorena sp. SIO4G3]
MHYAHATGTAISRQPKAFGHATRTAVSLFSHEVTTKLKPK